MSAESQRLDRWLWFTRFFKTRSMASRFCVSGRLRVNATRVAKAHYGLKVGDVLTFPKGTQIRVIKVLALGSRRGPAAEARTLYEDLEPPAAAEKKKDALAARDRGAGRPTKSERRATDRLRGEG